MKRRASPPSPFDLALSSITNLTSDGAVRGITTSYRPKVQAGSNLNFYANTNTNTNVNFRPSSSANTYTNLNLNPYVSADAYSQSKRLAKGIEGERPDEEIFQLGMARFWAQKAHALREPFVPVEGVGGEAARGNTGSGGGGTGTVGVEWIPLLAPSPSEPLSRNRSPTSQTPSATPLSNDTIAAILTALKPSCPKAQAWVQAHHAAKAAQEQLVAKMREREGLRKQVLQRLRAKTLKALSYANASMEEVREVLGMLPAREEVKKGEWRADVDLEMDITVAGSKIPGTLGNFDLGGDRTGQKQFVRVSEAHARLLEGLGEIEEMNRAVGCLAGSGKVDAEDCSAGGKDTESESDDDTIDDLSEDEDEMNLVGAGVSEGCYVL
ncbi:hypothetical protein BJX63DRAFT_429707 [Aspergillus granulosus]|uniref:Uncharacterized protein n=1 Tax=Aspergillus granulosus TaxID=176169 RepID=A0ABR4HPM3_9EURO